MNLSCIKAIKSTYSAYRGSKTTHKKGMNEYLEAEKEAGAHEAIVSIIETIEEHSAKRSRQAVAKRPHSSLFCRWFELKEDTKGADRTHILHSFHYIPTFIV